MKLLKPTDIEPRIQIANYFETTAEAAWGPREMPDWELILVVAGRFRYESALEGDSLVRRGQILAIPPGSHHVFRRVDDSSYAVISCIHCELLREGTWLDGDYGLEIEPRRVTSTPEMSVFQQLFRRAADLFTSYSVYRDALLRGVVREIWLRLAEYWQGSSEKQLSRRMNKMIAFLRDNIERNLTRQELAEEFGLTPEYVNALFRKELGISPSRFMNRERILLACHYMQSEGLSVKEAAGRLGFCDQFHFSKVFKKVMGFPPSHIA
ncbi:MAG: helix-turn-helix domain-containing protein [Sedimentisphaerales bacterium]|nr:helix-turn-helix domain-containing protein [Sedimentisphaerales bacterium]